MAHRVIEVEWTCDNDGCDSKVITHTDLAPPPGWVKRPVPGAARQVHSPSGDSCDRCEGVAFLQRLKTS